jgi:hypothetical protein
MVNGGTCNHHPRLLTSRDKLYRTLPDSIPQEVVNLIGIKVASKSSVKDSIKIWKALKREIANEEKCCGSHLYHLDTFYGNNFMRRGRWRRRG